MADEMQRFDNAITFANQMLTAKKTRINELMLHLNLSDLSSNGWRTAEQRHRSALNIHQQMCQRPSKRYAEALQRWRFFKPRRAERRLGTMPSFLRLAVAVAATCSIALGAQTSDARRIAQERAQAELDVPKLVDVLELKPGMIVADIGSGGGAMTVVLGHWIGSGRVYATDITEHALRETRDYAKKEGLTNVTVIEGAAGATNLPDQCCDAVFLRHVYHHITEIAAFNKSLRASLKPGGRLAIIDFEPRRPNPAEIPKGVPANRLGHGIPASVVIEEVTAAGFTHVRTIDAWPPGDKSPTLHLTLFRK